MPGCPPRHVCVAERRSLLTYLLTTAATTQAHGPLAARAPARPGAARDRSRRRAHPIPGSPVFRHARPHRTTLNAGPPPSADPRFILYPFTLHSGRGPDGYKASLLRKFAQHDAVAPLALKYKVSLRKVDETFRHVGRRKAQTAA